MIQKESRRPGQRIRRQRKNLIQKHPTVDKNIRQPKDYIRHAVLHFLEFGFSVIPVLHLTSTLFTVAGCHAQTATWLLFVLLRGDV